MNTVSPSAKGVACLRYMEAHVSRDTLAKCFCDKEGQTLAKKWLKLCPYVGRAVAVRSRHIEDVAARYIEECGIKQMMNIAAGLNTFSYRHNAASKLARYAELDLPPMIDFKKDRIALLKKDKVISNALIDVDYIPVDLHSKNFFRDFKNINWDWHSPAIYVFEGMSYYLSIKLLQKIMDMLSTSISKGSVLIWDYFPDYVKEYLDGLMNTIVDSGGEVCLTYLNKTEVNRLMEGFHVVSDRLESELEKEFYPNCISKPVGSIIVAEKR